MVRYNLLLKKNQTIIKNKTSYKDAYSAPRINMFYIIIIYDVAIIRI